MYPAKRTNTAFSLICIFQQVCYALSLIRSCMLHEYAFKSILVILQAVFVKYFILHFASFCLI